MNFIGDINTLEGGDGLSAQTEFAVVVIFDDVVVFIFGSPAEKFIASADRHDDSGRIVMGRGDMDDICLFFFQFGDFYTVAVHVNVLTRYLPAFVDLGDFAVSGIFHSIDFIFAEKLNQESVEVFSTGSDNDLFGQNSHSAKFFQVGGDCLTEEEDSAAWGIGHKLHLIFV